MAQRVPGRGARPAAQPRGGHAAAVGVRSRAPQVRLPEFVAFAQPLHGACMQMHAAGVRRPAPQARHLPMSPACMQMHARTHMRACACMHTSAICAGSVGRQAHMANTTACSLLAISAESFTLCCCLRCAAACWCPLCSCWPTLQRGGGAGGGGRALPPSPRQPGGHPAVHRAGAWALECELNCAVTYGVHVDNGQIYTAGQPLTCLVPHSCETA